MLKKSSDQVLTEENDLPFSQVHHFEFDLKILLPAQIVDVCDEHQKESKLARLLEEIGDEKIIVFTETKRKCDELTRCDADVIIDM